MLFCLLDLVVITFAWFQKQLLHWQDFSYREKATCSIVASHHMTKLGVPTDISNPVAA